LASKVWKPGGQDDGADLDFLELVFELEIDGVAVGAGLDAGLLALAGLELDAGLAVDDRGLRNGLREGKVNGAALAKSLVELVVDLGHLKDAGFDAFLAADAQILVDVAGAAAHAHLVVADVSGHVLDVGISPQVMLGWAFTLDILGVRMQAAQSSVGKVLSNMAMWPPMVASRSTR